MDSFDKKISQLYNGDEKSIDLPEGFGWEEMSDGIYEKMKEPKKKRKFLWIWFLFIGILGSLSVLFFLSQNTKDALQTPVAVNKTNEVNSKKENNPIISDKNPIDQNPVFTEKSQQNTAQNLTSNAITNNQTDNNNNNNNNSTLPRKNPDMIAPDLAFQNRELTPAVLPQNKVTITQDQIPSEVDLISTSNPASKIDASESNQIIKNRKLLAALPVPKNYLTAKPSVNSIVIAVPKNPKKETKPTLNDKKQKSKEKIKIASSFAPHIYGGTLLTSGKYRQNQQRNQHSKWLPGYYMGIEATILEYKKWKINLGYEHKFAVQKFDFQNITDTISTVVDDVLTGIRTNSLNGSSTQIRETVSTEAQRTRNYLHYNTFRSQAVRITVVRTFNLSKKLQLIAGAGSSYNFLTRTEGRTIGSNNNILDYDSENSIYRKHNLGIDGGFSLAYQINNFQIRGNCWIEKSLNYSVEPNENIRPLFSKIGLGVLYTFE